MPPMSLGVLPGLTSALGDELTLLAGHRSTRVVASALASTRVQSGVANASSADGVVVTFPADTLSADVAAGQIFRVLSSAMNVGLASGVAGSLVVRGGGAEAILLSGSFAAAVKPGTRLVIDSGPFAGESAMISRISADRTTAYLESGFVEDVDECDWSVMVDVTNKQAQIVSVTLGPSNSLTLRGAGIGHVFEDESWEIIAPPQTELSVETTHEWPRTGFVFADGIKYRYDDTTANQILHVRPVSHVGRQGQIVCVDADLILDGEEVMIDNGAGRILVIEFDKDDSLSRVDHLRVTIDDSMTADDVRDAIVAATATDTAFGVVFFDAGPGVVGLWNTIEGGSGFIDVSTTVSEPSFLVDGPRGVEQDVTPLTELVEYGRGYSALDRVRRTMFVETADGADLTVNGMNLGVARPAGLSEDLLYRRLVQAKAQPPSGALQALRRGLEALLGRGGFEIFEDFTRDPNAQPHYPGRVFVRKVENDTENYRGKAYLDGEVYVPLDSDSSLTMPFEPQQVVSVRIADEGVGPVYEHGVGIERRRLNCWLVSMGANASSADGHTVTLASGSFSADVMAGDIFELVSGPRAGARAVVMTRVGASITVTNGSHVLSGSPALALGGSFAQASWRVLREGSSFRWHRPSDESVIEVAGGSSIKVWGFAGNNETTRFFNQNNAHGPHLVLNDITGNTAEYRHSMRVTDVSDVTIEAVFAVVSMDTASVDGRQFHVSLRDGFRDIALGLVYAGGEMRLQPIDGTGTAIGSSYAVLGAEEWVAVRVEKKGTADVRFLVSRAGGPFDLFAAVAQASFGASGERRLIWGAGVAADTGLEVMIKSIDFHAATEREYANTMLTNCGTSSAGHIEDLDAGGWFRAGDEGKTVRITRWQTNNAGGGNPRGEWVIDSLVGAGPSNYDEAVLVGPRRRRANTQVTPRGRVIIEGDFDAFAWPDVKGHQLEILSGPNAGTYDILRVLDPETMTDLDSLHPQTVVMIGAGAGPDDVPIAMSSNVIEVDGDFVADDELEDWRIVPVFANDAGPVEAEIVDTVELVGDVVTLRQPMPVTLPCLVSVLSTSVQSAHLDDAEHPHIVSEGTDADSVDGVAVTLSAGAGADVSPGNVLTVYDSPLPAQRRGVVASSVGDELTLQGDGLGASFTDQTFRVTAGPANIVVDGAPDLFTPFYVWDAWGEIREAVQDLAAYGVVVDFDSLFRDAQYPTGVEGLHVIES